MRIEELKKGLWGYKKESIFQYIAEQEETFSKKLLEKNTQLEQLSQQYQTRIEELEAVLRQSQAELSALRAKQDRISDALLEAQACAERMKMETQAREQAAQEAVRKTLSAEMAELDRYQAKIADLRRYLQQTLQELSKAADRMEQKAAELTGESPAQNLTLFQRNPAQEDAI